MTRPAEADAQPQGTLWLLDLDPPLPVGPMPQVAVVFMRAGPEVAQELAQAMHLDDHTLVLQRFANGRQCYVGRVDGRMVTYGWVTFDEEEIGELSLNIRLKAGEAYIWNCATLPAYRGQRLYPALLAYIVGELHRQGLRRIWIGTDTDNLPSQSGIAQAGFRPIGDIVSSHGSTMRRSWLRGRHGIPAPLVEDMRSALLGDGKEVWLDANSNDQSAPGVEPHQGQPLVLAGDPPESARAAMIMIHGRGASARDILTLVPDLQCPGFAYFAPQAAGNAWYPNSFLMPIASNEPGLSSGLAVISSLLNQLARLGIPAERTILLGFSQGACLMLEYVARNARRYGGVAGLSGGLIGPEGTPRNYPGSLADTPVFLGCSDADPHIPKQRVEHTAEILQRLGGNVTTRLYARMGHMVNEDELRFVQGMMAAIK
ncbi:MAG TPA: GNAT family N-acetyltransferase [Ktedonobacteraceae bacterium]|nr:GNAT family N-acetyltransferase [Ktedonobacteraceae bacterium]